MKTIEIISTSLANHYTSTGIASTVTGATYKVDGKEETVSAEEGKVLVLVVDGVEKDLRAGASYEVKEKYSIVPVKVYRKGGPAAAPWSGAKEEEKSTYYFRQALLVDGGKIVDDASVTDAIVGGTYDAATADGITVNLGGPHFNGILLDNATKYDMKNSKVYAYGDGGDDLSGWGASLMADNKSEVEVKDSYIETEGATRCCLYVDNTSVAKIDDSVLYSQETPDTVQEYADLVPAMMKRVPFSLGMEGTVRTLNVMADGQGIFNNDIVVSTGWGALSTDSGTAYDICGTYALDVYDTLSGIGKLEVAQEGKEYTATKEINGVKYGFTVGGSGYVTYADSGVHNRYTNCEFYSPDFIQVMGSGRTGSSYIDCYLQAGHNAFMTQQTGGGTFDLTNTTVDTVDALMQIKSGAANTGFSNIILDNCKVNFSGTSTRTKDGILVELVESDDAGNPGITTYTINDHAEEAEATSSTIADCSATLKNGEYKGDIYNDIYNYKQVLNVALENASLKGVVSSTQANHVDLDGKVVPNGTVLNAFLGDKETDKVKYEEAKSLDCKVIGRYNHKVAPILNNPINVALKNSTWTVTGESYINDLTADSISNIKAEKPVTLNVKSLKADGKTYADGTYTDGNVTIVVDSTVIEVADNGIADAGQTYGNVVYKFNVKTADGELNSKAVTVKRQNFIDGNLYFKVTPVEGYEVVSISEENGTITKNTAGGELAAYDSMMAPAQGTKEMAVNITVKKA